MGEQIFEEGDEVYLIITANRLGDGHVVYFTHDAGHTGWTTRVQSATVFTAGEVEDALARAKADEAANVVVAPYATEIAGKKEPLGTKESIRASGGPTIRFGEARVSPKDPDYTI